MVLEIASQRDKAHTDAPAVARDSLQAGVLRTVIPNLLERYDGLCMDAEKDRQVLANALNRALATEIIYVV